MPLIAGSLACWPLEGDLSLVERSPFIWPGFNEGDAEAGPASASTSSGDYEFHAVYEFSGSTHVLLKDRRSSKFLWLLVGQEKDGLEPVSYNSDSDRLLLSSASGETWLDLQDLPEVSGTPVATAPASRTAATQRSTSTPRRAIVRPSSSSISRSRSSGSPISRAVRTSRPDGNSPVSISTPRSRSRRDIGLTQPTELPPEQDLSPPDTEAPSGGPPAPPSGGAPPPPSGN